MFRSVLSKSLLPLAARTSRAPTLARAYHEKVISHYEQPRNVNLISAESSFLSDNPFRRWARYQRVTSMLELVLLVPQRTSLYLPSIAQFIISYFS